MTDRLSVRMLAVTQGGLEPTEGGVCCPKGQSRGPKEGGIVVAMAIPQRWEELWVKGGVPKNAETDGPYDLGEC